MLLPPPSIGSVAGLSLAFAPAAWRAAVLSGPLSFGYVAAKSAGGASPPLVLINLGFALSNVGSDHASSGAPASTTAASFTAYEMAVVVLVKLVLLPAAHLLLCPTLHPTGGAREGSGLDPFHLVLLLQSAMPAAVSLQAIFHREGAETKPLGPLMLLQYGACMPTIVLAIVCLSQLA